MREPQELQLLHTDILGALDIAGHVLPATIQQKCIGAKRGEKRATINSEEMFGRR